MAVDWGTVKDVVEVLVLLTGIGIVLLAAWLKKYFPGREEISRLASREEIANAYVDKVKFADEMQKLRDDLHVQLGTHANNTDRLLREGIQLLRDQVNGMSPRIQDAHDKAIVAEGIATRTLEMLARVESDSGGLRSDMNRLTENVSKMREDLGFIRGKFST